LKDVTCRAYNVTMKRQQRQRQSKSAIKQLGRLCRNDKSHSKSQLKRFDFEGCANLRVFSYCIQYAPNLFYAHICPWSKNRISRLWLKSKVSVILESLATINFEENPSSFVHYFHGLHITTLFITPKKTHYNTHHVFPIFGQGQSYPSSHRSLDLRQFQFRRTSQFTCNCTTIRAHHPHTTSRRCYRVRTGHCVDSC
jgi:hypothetical protein